MQKASLEINRDTDYQIHIPEEITSGGKILGAVYSEFGDTQCLTLFNSKRLYFIQLVNQKVCRYSSYELTNISSLVSLIKGYLLITTKNQKLWLFQLKKIQKKINQQEEKVQRTLNVESYLKQIPFSSYFLREVTPNMVQIFITTPINEKMQRNTYIYQFTVKQKVGGMGFTLDKNYKMVSQSRKHLYASKSFYDSSINSLLKLKNFSDLAFISKKINEQYLHIIPVGKTEQFIGFTKNFELVNIEAPNQKKRLNEELASYRNLNTNVHLNYLLLEKNDGKLGLFILQQSFKLRYLGEESKEYEWKICFNGRLVGVSSNNQRIKVTRELNKKNQAIVSTTEQIKILQAKNEEKVEQEEDKNEQKEIKEKQKQKQKQGQSQKIEEGSSSKQKQDEGQKNKQKSMQQTSNIIEQEKPKSFKPTKVISRKDLKKEAKTQQIKKQQVKMDENIKKEESKQQEILVPVDEKSNNQNSQQVQNDDQSGLKAKQIQQQKINETMKINQKESGAANTEKQSSNKRSQEKGKLNLWVLPPKQNQQQKQEKKLEDQTKNEETGKQKTIDNQNTTIKNSLRANTGSQSSVFVPSVSYQQIFGKINAKIKQASALFFQKPEQKRNCGTIQKKEQLEEANNEKKEKKEMEMKEEVSENFEQENKKDLQDQKQKNRGVEDKKDEDQERDNKIKDDEALSCEWDEVGTIEKQKQEQKSEIERIQLDFIQNSFNKFEKNLSGLAQKTQDLQQALNKLPEEISAIIVNKLLAQQNRFQKLVQETMVKQLENNIEKSVNEYFSKKVTIKVNQYFRYVLTDTKKIYDSTLKFYSEKKKESIISLHNHFQEQEHLVNQIKAVSSNMLANVDNTVAQGQQMHGYLLKEWDRQILSLNSKLQANLTAVENHSKDRSADQRQKIIDLLTEVRQSIGKQKIQKKKKKQLKEEPKKKKKKQSQQKQRKQEKQRAVLFRQDRQQSLSAEKVQEKIKEKKVKSKKRRQKEKQSEKEKLISEQLRKYKEISKRNMQYTSFQMQGMPLHFNQVPLSYPFGMYK